jgi:hypothetical protein
MSNEAELKSYQAGDWSITSDVAASPWYGPDQAGIAGAPDTIPWDDTPYSIVSLYHAVRVDRDAICGGYFPSAPWAPPVFSASAGSTVTRLPTGLYRVSYQINYLGTDSKHSGFSSAGNSETAQISIVNGVSKPRVTFPSAPPTGANYTLYMTQSTGVSGTEYMYCDQIKTAYVDLVTELWYSPHPVTATPTIVDTIPGGEVGGGSFPFNPQDPTRFAMAKLGITNALTIFPGGSLTIAAGKTLRLGGDIWIASAPTDVEDFITLERGANLLFVNDLSQMPVAWTDYKMWFAGGGRIKFIG